MAFFSTFSIAFFLGIKRRRSGLSAVPICCLKFRIVQIAEEMRGGEYCPTADSQGKLDFKLPLCARNLAFSSACQKSGIFFGLPEIWPFSSACQKSGIFFSVPEIWYFLRRVRNLAFSSACQKSGLFFSVPEIWYFLRVARNLAFSSACQKSGIFFCVSEIWHFLRRARNLAFSSA